MPIVKCAVCGKEIKKSNYQIKTYKNHFCSIECMKIFQTKDIELKCDYCGKLYKTKKHKIKNSKKHYCSDECAKLGLRKRTTIKCDYCGKEFEVTDYDIKASKKHYCSRECYHLDYRKKHNYIEKEDWYELEVDGCIVKFDKEDFDIISQYRWKLLPCNNNIYCRATTRELMHRVIFKDLKPNEVVDHISHDSLDNRKCNLRVCSYSDNCQNLLLNKSYTKSKHTYITVDNRWNTRYKVRITINGKRINFGEYPTLEQAIQVRDNALKENNKYFGDLHIKNEENQSLTKR